MSEETATPDARIGTETGVDLAEWLPMVGIVVLYFATVLGGMAMADEIAAADLMAFTDPQDVGNVGEFAVILLAWTVVLVVAERLDLGKQLLRLVMLGVFGMALSWLVIAAGHGSHTSGVPTSPLPVGVTLAAVAVLWVYPEWYVLDVAAVLAGAALIPSFGLSFGPLPIVVLLVAWAAYDAYAVYVSGHMNELVSGFGDMLVPAVYVVPGSLDYSIRDGLDLSIDEDEENGSEDGDAPESETTDPDAGDDETDDEDDDTPVRLLGLGDAIIPGMLAVSASAFLPAPEVVPALNANLPAIGALAGGLLGMAALSYVVSRFEGTHAGLPPLNAGVLLGYLAGAVAAGVPVTTALGI